MIVIESEDFHVEPLQAKHPIVDWEIHTDEFGSTQKITRVGGQTESYNQFEDLIKACDKEDLDTLWKLVKENSKSDGLSDVKAKEIWVHFQKLYEPDPSDRYWKFEAHNMNTVWRFYDSCNIYHVSTKDGIDVFMLAEKEYPLTVGILKCEERIKVIDDLIQSVDINNV